MFIYLLLLRHYLHDKCCCDVGSDVIFGDPAGLYVIFPLITFVTDIMILFLELIKISMNSSESSYHRFALRSFSQAAWRMSGAVCHLRGNLQAELRVQLQITAVCGKQTDLACISLFMLPTC